MTVTDLPPVSAESCAKGDRKPVSREDLARRLLRSSAKASFDPLVEIDWDAPIDPALPGLPWHRSSLYGTELWDAMSDAQRAELTRHEAASVASVGIWFELILISMLTRHVYELDAKSLHVQYALTEIADECRHSIMFGKMCEKLGAPAYGPGSTTMVLGKLFRAIANPVEIFAAALFVEEVLDALQREAIKDDSVQPLVRDVMNIHVVEEARHMRYASEEMARQWERMPAARKWLTSVHLATACATASSRLIHPRVYAAAGLDIERAKKLAADNPKWRETKAWAARKVLSEFEQLGMLDPTPARRIYQAAGLWSPRS